MPIPMGNNRVNAHPCTEDQERRNWTLIQNNIDVFNEFIDKGGTDSFTVKVTADDKTDDFLHPKFNDPGSYTSGRDPLIFFEAVGDPDTVQTERAFLYLKSVPGYSATGALNFQLVDDVFRLVEASTGGGGGTDAFTVLAGKNDSTPSTLIDATTDPAAYAEFADMLVGTAVVGAPLSDQTVRFFVDASEIEDYADDQFLLYALDNDKTKFVTIESLFDKITIIGGTFEGDTLTFTAASEQYRRIRGLAVSNTTSADATFLVNNVIPLDSGLDPVSGNPATQIRVANAHSDFFATGDLVEADRAVAIVASPATDWVCSARDGVVIVVKITDVISARSSTTLGSGTAQPVSPYALGTNLGGTVTVKNLAGISYTGSSETPIYMMARRLAGMWMLETTDTRAFAMYVPGSSQVYQHGVDIVPMWENTGPCTS